MAGDNLTYRAAFGLQNGRGGSNVNFSTYIADGERKIGNNLLLDVDRESGVLLFLEALVFDLNRVLADLEWSKNVFAGRRRSRALTERGAFVEDSDCGA